MCLLDLRGGGAKDNKKYTVYINIRRCGMSSTFVLIRQLSSTSGFFLTICVHQT